MKPPQRCFKLVKNRAVLCVIFLCFVSGLILGAISANTMDNLVFNQVANNLDSYLHSFANPGQEDIGVHNGDAKPKMDMFRNSVFKYAKLVVIIWFLAFIPAGGFAVFILLLLRGVSYGFTTALLINQFGAPGFLTSVIMYVPQCLLVVPACFYMAYHCVNYILFSLYQKKGSHARGGKNAYNLIDYAAILFIGCAASVLAGFMDVFIVPQLIASVL